MITKINGSEVSAQRSDAGGVTVFAEPTPDSGMDASGTWHGVTYPWKYKATAVWAQQTVAERAALLTAILASSHQAVAVEMLSPVTGELVTKTCRMTPEAVQSLTTYIGAGTWGELTLEFIEN